MLRLQVVLEVSLTSCYALIHAVKLVFPRYFEDRPGALFGKLLDLPMRLRFGFNL